VGDAREAEPPHALRAGRRGAQRRVHGASTHKFTFMSPPHPCTIQSKAQRRAARTGDGFNTLQDRTTNYRPWEVHQTDLHRARPAAPMPGKTTSWTPP
jgi:hypothetical protein